MAKLKVGVIGAGAISHDHFSGINRHPQAEVIAVADTSGERRAEFSAKYGLRRLYCTAQELIDDDDLDAVTIAVPNVYHAPLAIAALRAGRHVLLEKPFARNLAEAVSVVHAANRCGKVLMVGMNQRYDRSSQIARKMIQRGQIGEVYHAKTTWMRRAGIPRFGTWFCRKDMSGGGALLDIGVHMLDLAMHLIGNFEPELVSGATYGKFGPRDLHEGTWGKSDRGEHRFDVDDFATALIKFRGGATASLDVSWAVHQESVDYRQIQIFGTAGGMYVNPHARLCQWQCEPTEYAVVEMNNLQLDHPACCRFANWIDAIMGNAEILCTLDEALMVQNTIDAIYESAATGREVHINPCSSALKLSA